MSKPLLNKWLWLQSFHYSSGFGILVNINQLNQFQTKYHNFTPDFMLPIPCLTPSDVYLLQLKPCVKCVQVSLSKAPNSKLPFWSHDRWIVTEFMDFFAFLPDNSKSDQTFCCFRRLQFTTVSRQTTWVFNCHLFHYR